MKAQLEQCLNGWEHQSQLYMIYLLPLSLQMTQLVGSEQILHW